MTSPQHTAPAGWSVRDDCLMVGGIPLTQLALRVGRTPFYAYDRRLIDERIAYVRKHVPAPIKLHYALKANPMPALVCHMARLVDGMDVASAGELKVALDSGIDPDVISFAGPGKSEAELAQAVAAGIVVSLESPREVSILDRLRRDTGFRARVLVRVNPDFELRSSGMKMGGGAKQFGIDADAVPSVLDEIGRCALAFEGFHIFAGSQNLNADAICEAQERAVELAVRLSKNAHERVRTVNIGGGFGIPYFPGEEPLDLSRIGRGLNALVGRIDTALPDASLVIELGRYLVGEAGIYVSRVTDRKVSRGQVFLVTDGGMHHHLAASGNFGQIIRKNYPVVIGNRCHGTTREIASVVGPLCTPLDFLADKIELARAQEGDLVAVFQSGAYGLTASPTSFLGHPLPAETLV